MGELLPTANPVGVLLFRWDVQLRCLYIVKPNNVHDPKTRTETDWNLYTSYYSIYRQKNWCASRVLVCIICLRQVKIVDRLHGDSSIRHGIVSGNRLFRPIPVGEAGKVSMCVSSACTASIYILVAGDRLCIVDGC